LWLKFVGKRTEWKSGCAGEWISGGDMLFDGLARPKQAELILFVWDLLLMRFTIMSCRETRRKHDRIECKTQK
jgi:hypothetical protein